MSRAISRLVVLILSIFAFGYFSCDAYVDFSSIERKCGVSLFEFSDKFRDDNIKDAGYVETCIFDSDNGARLIWDSDCIFGISFPEKIGEIYEREGYIFEAVLAHVG